MPPARLCSLPLSRCARPEPQGDDDEHTHPARAAGVENTADIPASRPARDSSYLSSQRASATDGADGLQLQQLLGATGVVMLGPAAQCRRRALEITYIDGARPGILRASGLPDGGATSLPTLWRSPTSSSVELLSTARVL